MEKNSFINLFILQILTFIVFCSVAGSLKIEDGAYGIGSLIGNILLRLLENPLYVLLIVFYIGFIVLTMIVCYTYFITLINIFKHIFMGEYNEISAEYLDSNDDIFMKQYLIFFLVPIILVIELIMIKTMIVVVGIALTIIYGILREIFIRD